MKWTREEEAILLQAHKEGMTTQDIAKLSPARSLGAIQAKIIALGLRASPHSGYRKWTEDDDFVLADAFEDGLTDNEIAAKYLPHFAPETIRRKRSTLGLWRNEALRRDRVSPDELGMHPDNLRRSSFALLDALREHHYEGTGELRVPTDGGHRLPVKPTPPGLMTSAAALCAEA